MLDHLSRNQLLYQLDDEVLEGISSSVFFQEFGKDNVIVNGFSDDFRQLYMILSGKVRIIFYDKDVRHISFFDVEENQFFGEYHMFWKEKRNYVAVALEPVSLGVISYATFKDLIMNNSVALNLLDSVERYFEEVVCTPPHLLRLKDDDQGIATTV